MSTTSPRNPVGWFEIYVRDMERAKTFYETVLDKKLEKLPVQEIEMWTFPGDPDAPGCCGALVKMDGVQGGAALTTMVYFSCQDCATEASRVEAAGGKLQRPKMSIGQYGHIALAIDTEGNLFGLHSMA